MKIIVRLKAGIAERKVVGIIGLKLDIIGLKLDVIELKAGIVEPKAEIITAKGDMAGLKERVKEMDMIAKERRVEGGKAAMVIVKGNDGVDELLLVRKRNRRASWVPYFPGRIDFILFVLILKQSGFFFWFLSVVRKFILQFLFYVCI